MDLESRIDRDLAEGFRRLTPFRLPDDLASLREAPVRPTSSAVAVKITERYISGADGHEMFIKIYEPAKRDGTRLPALLWIHGGGYVLGHPNGEDMICEGFAIASGCVVVSPDYRLAPEHPYPAAIEDCYAALQWVAGAEEALTIDTARIAIGGASAGGGLTAALALLARDRGGPAICFQMPLYPMIDDRNATPSSHEIEDRRIWNGANNAAAWRMYLGDGQTGAVSPYAAPSRAEDLTGLPPAYTCVGQLDPFRDETIDYVARLARAGVDVEFHLYPGGYHAFEHIVPDAEISRRAKNDYMNALARAFHK